MGRIWLAIKVFFLVLFQGAVARQVAEVLQKRKQESLPAAEKKPAAKPEPKPAAKQPPKAARSEAITLLAALQREARFVDFIKEPLDGYSDAQIGAAVRDVHRDCGKVLDRLFAIQSIVDQEEGSPLDVPAGLRRRPLPADGQRGGRSAVSWPPGASRLGSGRGPVAGLVGHAALRPGRRPDRSGVGMSSPQFILGFDLGTTNSVLAYAPLDAEQPAGSRRTAWPCRNLWQRAPSSRGRMLPSFTYLANPNEASGGALDLPWAAGARLCRGRIRPAARGRSARPDRRRGQVVAGL